MTRQPVALIVGGGVGGHIADPVLDVLIAAGAEFDFHRVDINVLGAQTPED